MKLAAASTATSSGTGHRSAGVSAAQRLADGESRALAAALELLTQLEPIDDLTVAAELASELLNEFSDAQRVVIGWCNVRDSTCRVIADTSQHAGVASDSSKRTAEYALDELIVRGRLTQIDSEKPSGSEPATLAIRQFVIDAAARRLIGAPLIDAQGITRGAWMFVDPASQIESLASSRFIDSLSRPLGARLATIARHQPGRIENAMHTLHESVSQNRSSLVVAGLILLLIVILFPIHYAVRCDCALQPVSRRLIAAPFDGSLEESFVRPGDLIDEGALLARISARELDWELAGLKADLNRSIKERKVSMAKQDTAASQIAQLDSQRLTHRVQLIQSRIEHLEIRSPMKGVVVAGDIHEVQGAPLETGQTLLEIAPLGEMIVELMIPEEDFAYVQPAMSVRLRLHAFPTQHIEGVVQRVHPQAEVIENQNVFVAEMRIQDPHAIYRPGMHGRARIESVRRPLLWVLLHKPWSALLMWLGW